MGAPFWWGNGRRISDLGVGAHCICAREGICEIAAATGGYIIRPYRVRCAALRPGVIGDDEGVRFAEGLRESQLPYGRA